MIVLHAAPMPWSQTSGIAQSLLGLLEAQNGLHGVRAAAVSTHPSPGQPPPTRFPIFSKSSLSNPRRLDLQPPFDRPDLVVFHSTYIPFHALLARRLRRWGIPYLVCPHGGMTRGAQRTKALKKTLGNWFFFDRLVAGAAALHCLTRGEAQESAAWGKPAFVAGNGIPLPGQDRLAHPGCARYRRLLYIGRLDCPLKGLNLLLDACQLAAGRLRAERARVELRGPDQNPAAAGLRRRIARMGLSDVVSVGPAVVGEDKYRLLAQVDAFLHPSLSEAHPMAVLEALAFGLPCLLTPGTRMADDVAAAEAGWHVQESPPSIAAGLETILETSPGRLAELGRNARRMAEAEFRWDTIARRTVEEYGRVLSSGAAQACGPHLPSRPAACNTSCSLAVHDGLKRPSYNGWRDAA